MSVRTSLSRRTDDREFAVKSQLEVWEGQNRRLRDILEELTDEQLSRRAFPGTKSGLDIVGHLVAVNDGLLPQLGFGERRFPDETGATRSSDVLAAWAGLVDELSDNFVRLSPDEWFENQTGASDDDLMDEPPRRINVLIDQTHHIRHHLGQLNRLRSETGN
jgi:uncharacterized damage-inducible protein DinB